MSLFKKFINMFKPGARVISNKEMEDKINDYQRAYGLAEDELPEMLREKCPNCHSDLEETYAGMQCSEATCNYKSCL